MNRNPDVDRWLDEAGHPLEAALRRAREIILEADERVAESITWKTPTFAYKGEHRELQPVEDRRQHHVLPRIGDPRRPPSPRRGRQARPHHAVRRPRRAGPRSRRSRGGDPPLVHLESRRGPRRLAADDTMLQ